MRLAAWCLLFVIAGSGCLSVPTDGQAEPIVADGVPVVVSTDGSLVKYRFDLTALTFENSLKTFRIVAERDTTVDVAVEGALGEYATRDDCFGIAVFSPEGHAEAPGGQAEPEEQRSSQGTIGPSGRVGLAHVNLAWRNNGFQPGAEVSGVVVEPPAITSYSQGVAMPVSAEESWWVPAGASVIIQAGGKTNQYVRGPDGEPNSYTLEVSMGPGRVEPLPDAAVRCGVGFHDLDGEIARVNGILPGATVGGQVSLETRNATTMMFSQGITLVDPARSARLHYPGSPDIEVTGVSFSFSKGTDAVGTAGFTIDHWASELSSWPKWFIADTRWPEVTWHTG